MPSHAAKPLTPLSTAILVALLDRPLHGYALMQAIGEQSNGALSPGTGTLYAALMRLLDNGLIEDAGEDPTDSRRGRSYRVSGQGRSLLRAEAARMSRVIELARRRGLFNEGELLPEGGA